MFPFVLITPQRVTGQDRNFNPFIPSKGDVFRGEDIAMCISAGCDKTQGVAGLAFDLDLEPGE